MAQVSSNATVYRKEGSGRFSASLTSGEVAYITNNANGSWTKGLVVYEALHLAHSYLDDELSMLGNRMESIFRDDVGTEISQEVSENNIINEKMNPKEVLRNEANKAGYTDFEEKKRSTLYLPRSTIESLKEENGKRGVSDAISEAIHKVIQMPYDTRFEKFDIMDEFLKINSGSDLGEDVHPFIQSVIDGSDNEYNVKLSDEYDWHEKTQQERWAEVVREDLENCDFDLDSDKPWETSDHDFCIETLRTMLKVDVFKQTKDVRVAALTWAIMTEVDLNEEEGFKPYLYGFMGDFYDHIEMIFECSRPTARNYGKAVMTSSYSDGLIVKPSDKIKKYQVGTRPYAGMTEERGYRLQYKSR